jgi:manganese efflux pump family protein
MSLLQMLALALAIGANNFAAALALGSLGQTRRWPRVALVFGAMEFSIPLLGIWLGRGSAHVVGDAASWLGPLLLIALGVWVASSPLRQRPRDAERMAERAATWGGLVLMSFGLAADNVVVGFSLGLGSVDALLVAGLIAVAAVVFAVIGLHVGRVARRTWETAATIGAGAVLVAVGVGSALF